MKVISLSRINSLIEGKVAPEGTGELILLDMYAKSLHGEPLVNIIIDEKGSIDKFDSLDLSMLILGYALGQKEYLENEGMVEMDKIIIDGDDTVH